MERARVYRGLARLFQLPDAGRLEALRGDEIPGLRLALEGLEVEEPLRRAAADVARRLDAAVADSLAEQYSLTFDADGGFRCPPNETSLVPDSASEQMTRTYVLADVAGFYRAFGVEVAPGGERADHISAELEFMHLLALKEAVALEAKAEEQAAVCRDAARSFLSDHLGRFAPRLAEHLQERAADPLYAAAGRLLTGFVAFDTAWCGAEAERPPSRSGPSPDSPAPSRASRARPVS